MYENLHVLITKHSHTLAGLESLAPWEFEIMVQFVVDDNTKKK